MRSKILSILIVGFMIATSFSMINVSTGSGIIQKEKPEQPNEKSMGTITIYGNVVHGLLSRPLKDVDVSVYYHFMKEATSTTDDNGHFEVTFTIPDIFLIQTMLVKFEKKGYWKKFILVNILPSITSYNLYHIPMIKKPWFLNHFEVSLNHFIKNSSLSPLLKSHYRALYDY